MDSTKKNLLPGIIYSLILGLGGILASGASIAQSHEINNKNKKDSHFFEISYGGTSSGTIKSDKFTAYGLDNLNAELGFGKSKAVNLEYGVRKAWDSPIDVAVSWTQLQTPVVSIKIQAIPISIPLSRNSITNFYFVNAYHDLLSIKNCDAFVGAGVGWSRPLGTEFEGLTTSLTVGARYNMGKAFYGVFKYKLITIPKSTYNEKLLQRNIELPKTIMPIFSMGIGVNF
jgi:hypothetical protein